MAASGYSPISLYYSTTASATPTNTNLVNGELAINITDGKLFYKDNGGTVQLLASKAGASGDVVGPSSATNNGIALFDGTTGKLIKNSAASDGLIYGITVGRGAGAVATNTAVGASALQANTTGNAQTVVGYNAMYTNTTGAENTAFGYNSLYYNTTGNYNVAIGRSALQSNTTASNNTAVGYQAGYSNQTGAQLTAFGFQSLYSTTGSWSSALGYKAGYANTSGGVTAFGAFALTANTTGVANTGVGGYDGSTGVTGALAANTTGAYNIAVGTGALSSNTTASNNTAVGYQSLYANTTGTSNDAFGFQALTSNTTANGNSAFGRFSLYSNTTGALNVAMGTGAVQNNTTGSNNTGLGYQALLSNTTASNNTAVGYQAGYSNTTGTRIVAIGQSALYSNTTGNYIVAVGRGAGYSNQTGQQSTFVGDNAGYLSTNGGNTFIGAASGYSVTTGTLNTFVGGGDVSSVYPSGYFVTTGSKNTILGNYNGNQGGLDIRTANNYIVLSDGDGNPRWINDGTDNWGAGVDPSAWVSGFRAIELTNAVALWSQDSTPSSWLTVNAYFDGAWKYKTSAAFSGYNQSGGYHTWYSNASGTANATFTPTQVLATVQGSSLALQGANPQVGTGITFPATQSASYNANTLDDYERGTFTATLKGQISDPTTPVTTTGYYTKIGNLVYVKVGFESVNTTGGSGGAYITGLPFLNVNARAFGGVGSYGGLAWNYQVTSMISIGANYIDLMDIRSANIWTNATINVSSSAYIWATVTYTVV